MSKPAIVQFAILLLFIVTVGCSSSDQVGTDKSDSATIVAQPETPTIVSSLEPTNTSVPEVTPTTTSEPKLDNGAPEPETTTIRTPRTPRMGEFSPDLGKLEKYSDVLSDNTNDHLARRDAVRAIQREPSSRAIEILSKTALSDPSDELRVYAVHAIGQVADASAIPTLESIALDSSQSPAVRAASRNNIHAIRSVYPMQDPPLVSIEAIDLIDISKPFNVVVSVVSPVNRDYASVHIGGGRHWTQTAVDNSAENVPSGYRGPLKAGEKIELIASMQFVSNPLESAETLGINVPPDPLLTADPELRGIASIPVRLMTGTSGLDTTTYTNRLWVDFREEELKTSMDVPVNVIPDVVTEIPLNTVTTNDSSAFLRSNTKFPFATSYLSGFHIDSQDAKLVTGDSKVYALEDGFITVEGEIYYEDGDTIRSNPAAGSTPTLENSFYAPAYNAQVEICGITCGDTFIDADGKYSVTIAADVGTELTYKLKANNSVLKIYSDMDCVNEWFEFTLQTNQIVPNIGPSFYGNTFFVDPIKIPNQNHTHTVGTCWGNEQTVHFSSSGHLNITSVMSIAFDDVMDNRDPSQVNESIAKVDVIYCDNEWPHITTTWSSFDVNNEIYFPCYMIDGSIPSQMLKWQDGQAVDAGLWDEVLVHEYYHQVQNQIHAWDIGGGPHNRCEPNSLDWGDGNFGSGIELGFSEGTANYFADHIIHNKPNMSTQGALKLNSEYSCINAEGNISIEGLVQGVLWDLADDESSIFLTDTNDGILNDAWDLVDGTEIDGHRLIMQIMDKELDSSSWWEDAPDLGDFYSAWISRVGGSAKDDLDAILSGHGISANGVSFVPQLVFEPKNEPLPIIAKDFQLPNTKTKYPVNWGKSEEHTEYSVEIDMNSSTPFSVTRDYSYIGANYEQPVYGALLETGVYTIRQKINGRFLDAHENDEDDNDFSAVTRTYQENDSQKWVIQATDDGSYRIRQKINGRFLDAYENSNDFSAVTRPYQENDSQKWVIQATDGGAYRISQKINGRFLDAHENDEDDNDFSAVTRTYKENDSQKWVIESVSDLLVTSIGIANLNQASMPVSSNAVEPSSDEADNGNFTINTTPATASNWLTTSVNSGSFDPRRMTVLDINVLADQVASSTATYNATVNIVYQPVSSATPSTKSIDIILNVLDGADDDFDSDGFTSKQEVEDLPMADLAKWGCLDPSDSDSDLDGLKDGDEDLLHGTLPCNPDTDSDSINDGYEAHRDCLNPLIHDSGLDPDGDGLTNYQEAKGEGVVLGEDPWGHRTSPCNPDTDGDGVNDNEDNCAVTANADQANHDSDAWGDACDLDDDNDKCPDDGDHDPFDEDVFMDCYKLPYSTRVQMGFIDPLRDLIFIPNEEHMVLRVVPPKPGGDPWCGKVGCPAPHVRISDRDRKVLHELDPARYGFNMDDGFGLSATWVEDLDGDRVRDLILGIPFAAHMNRAGQAGSVIAISTRTGEEIGRINGSIQGSHFGHSIVALGDKHIAVGAPNSGAIGRNAGTVSLVDLEDFSISSVYQTGEHNDGFGHAMFGLPDMDGDRVGELVIGAPSHRSAGAVFLANSSSSKIELLAEGRGTDSSFGFAITSLGDIDGDRVIDLVVGAPNSEGIGSITMLDLNGKISWSLTGDARGEMFGASLAAYEETDPRSSTAMFIAGAPGYGRNNGAVYKISSLGESKLVARGNSEGAQLGSNVALMPGSKRNNGDFFVLGDLNNETNTHQSLFTNEIFNSGAEFERQSTRSVASR